MTEDRPDGTVAGVLWDYGRRVAAVERHAAAEGHEASAKTVLNGYDRALHPWTHGRRPSDLWEKFAYDVVYRAVVGRVAEAPGVRFS